MVCCALHGSASGTLMESHQLAATLFGFLVVAVVVLKLAASVVEMGARRGIVCNTDHGHQPVWHRFCLVWFSFVVLVFV